MRIHGLRAARRRSLAAAAIADARCRLIGRRGLAALVTHLCVEAGVDLPDTWTSSSFELLEDLAVTRLMEDRL